MIVLIAQVTGVSEISAIILIFGVNAAMILFGWLQGKYETPGNGEWLPFIFGGIAGTVPWVVLTFYVFSIGGVGDTSAPAFVYGIVFTIFLFFNSFTLVQWLQYKKLESGATTSQVNVPTSPFHSSLNQRLLGKSLPTP